MDDPGIESLESVEIDRLMNRHPRIEFDREALAALCRRHHIKRLAFFGSVLRDDFGPNSDIDVLYEFEEGRTPGFGFITVIDELSTLFGGRKVDMVPFEYMSPRFEKRVLPEAQLIYDAA